MDDCAGDTVKQRLFSIQNQRQKQRYTQKFHSISPASHHSLQVRHLFDSQPRSSNGYIYGDNLGEIRLEQGHK